MIFIKDMAKDNPVFPVLNGDVKHWEGACVGPANLTNCEPNFHAFAQEDTFMDLVPPSVMTQLKDKSNWSNRLSAANEIERILKQPSTAITNDNLTFVVELILTSMSDSQSKVSQKGLQVMVQLVSIVGKRILPFLPALTAKILVKMGSNKGDLKKFGMALFNVLMEAVGPAKVIVEVSSCGLTHKTSRVREEAVNVMILALLHRQNSGMHLPSVARELVVYMADAKPKVRQAAFEAMALLTSKLDDIEFNQVVALVGDVHTRHKLQHSSDLCLMDAYYARLERHSIPTLDEHGMVQYSVMPVSSDGAVSQTTSQHTGADVDWIVAPLKSTTTSHSQPVEVGSYSKATQRPSSPSFRPYRSAGKRPWETEGQSEVSSSTSPGPPTFPAEPPARPSILSPRFAPRTTSLPTASSTAPSGMKLPNNSYMDLHLSKLAKTSATPPVVPGHMPAVNPSAHHMPVLDSLKKPRSGKNFFVHVASMNGRDPQCSVPHQDPSPSVGEGPLSTPDDSSSSMSMTWPRATLCLSGTPSRVPSVLSARTGGPGLSSVAPLPLKGPTQINADTISLVESQNSVKTSFSRPHSKPRVRNPLSSLKRSPQPIPFTPGTGGIPNMGPNQENASQVEQDFLRGSTSTPYQWSDQSFDEEYYAIPEDNTVLNSSLSASLSSLCNKDSDPEVDKLKHIRKEAATRKAQILSTGVPTTSCADPQHYSGTSNTPKLGTSNTPKLGTSNTPKLGTSNTPKLAEPRSPPYNNMRVPPLAGKDLSVQQSKKCPALVHLDSMPPPIPLPKKWNSFDGGREDKTYSQAFLKKLANPTKPLKPAGQILAAQILPVTFPDEAGSSSSNTISLEGRGLDQSGDKPRDLLQQQKKRHRKDQLFPNRGRTTISTSLFQEGAGERRPTIERGGTNTITMEVSGIGSRNSAEHLPQPLLSKASEDSISPKKSASDFEISKKKSHSAVYPNNSHDPPLVVEEADDSTGVSLIASAPIETTHKRNKKKKPGQTSSPQKLQGNKVTAQGRHTYGWKDGDVQSSGVGGALMEMDLALLESHVHANPEQAVKTALQSLSKVDWTDKCEGIDMVVVIARDFPHLLLAQLHHILMALQNEVKNLRSSVAKKATECLGYLFSTMKRAMETDLDKVVQVLLYKTGDPNTFLRELVERALSEMVANVTLQKALLSLISGGVAHRNTQIRKLAAKYICVAIEVHEPSRFLRSNKDVLEKALPAIVQFTKDSSPDCRYYGRKCLNMLWPEPDYNHVTNRVLKNDLYTVAREAVETLKLKGVGDPPTEFKSHPSSTSTSRHPTGGATRLPNTALRDSLQDLHHGGSSPNTSSSPGRTPVDTPKKQRKQPQQQGLGRESGMPMPSQAVPLPDGLLERLQSNSWNERFEAISQLEEYVISARPQTLSAHLQRVFDAFTSRLTDRNSKVTLHALQAFASMVPLMHIALIPIINNILSTLINNLASRNVTLHSTAMTVLNLLSEHIDPVVLIPSVANSSQYGNARVQPIMTKRLASLTRLAYRQKPQLVSRHVLPVVWHHVSAKTPIKGEARLALQELCAVLQDCMQQGFLDSAAHLSVEDSKKLKELLDWDGSSR